MNVAVDSALSHHVIENPDGLARPDMHCDPDFLTYLNGRNLESLQTFLKDKPITILFIPSSPVTLAKLRLIYLSVQSATGRYGRECGSCPVALLVRSQNSLHEFGDLHVEVTSGFDLANLCWINVCTFRHFRNHRASNRVIYVYRFDV
ncbi:hypothetical protein HMPREF9238_00605 [Gleimia europaea ACS-120-V-Col10b]|uniref:Uncharacterized protein n=1 Tax=Gleimia europaea ACS-120-V-Col10b TaxID=883069 RepID=A0A9W5REE2_9ACTO|nr:hypothetical protein HMPREF9238_00605 [Gleimia europaea ACS-120-V-Col10b]